MNFQDELKVLKDRIAELEEQVKGEQEFPQEDDIFWFINTFGKPVVSTWGESITNRQLIEIGNMTVDNEIETTTAKPIYQQPIGDEAEPDILIIYEAEVDGVKVYPSVIKEAK